MRSGAIPFQFDMGDVLGRFQRAFKGRVGDVTLNLPFITVAVSPQDRERTVARKVVTRPSYRARDRDPHGPKPLAGSLELGPAKPGLAK